MFRNYVTSAMRALRRDRFHAVLNITGLAVSLSAALLIALYIQHELSYEDFFTEPERVYRLETRYDNAGQPPIRFGATPGPTKDALESDFPGLMTVTRLAEGGRIISTGEKTQRSVVIFGDENLFDVLDLPMARGDGDAALSEPGNVLLSREMALSLYGTEDAIGESLQIGPDHEFRVAGILETMPRNTHLKDGFDVLASIDSPVSEVDRPWNRHWGNANFYTYVRLAPGVRPEPIAEQLGPLVDRRMSDAEKVFTKLTLTMRAIEDVHLHAGDRGFTSDSNALTVYALGGTAVFLILIACFNYINLSTARALLRVKEVGMRKILGASTRQLVTQFLGETVITTLIAFLLAVGLAAALLPAFATLVNRALPLTDLVTPGFMAGVVMLLAVVSLAAGAYPALYLASSKPVDLFQNRRNSTGGRSPLRAIMVGAQFTLTVGLIIAATVVFTQVNYMRTIDLGFQRQGMIVISDMPAGDEAERSAAFRDALVQSPFVTAVGGSNSRPRQNYENNIILSRSGVDGFQDLAAQVVNVGPGFFDVFEIEAIQGRVFSEDFGDEEVSREEGDITGTTGKLVISESAVAHYGFASPRDAVGKHLVQQVEGRPGDFEIIGVVPDIHYRLAHAPMKPMVYRYSSPGFFMTIARVAPGGHQGALQHIQDTWGDMFPERPLSYVFLADMIDAANADDVRQSQLFAAFTGLAILVACLGLFGLASFVAARRTQEIAIRKVMGASTPHITGLLLWDFAKPVLLANIVAWPVAWLLMRQWLNGFAYRVELSPLFFIGASAAALAVALLTVMVRTLRAARTRPAMALKYE